jgi:hypothetical protein
MAANWLRQAKLAVSALALIGATLAVQAAPNDRVVVVNGQRLTPQQLVMLERMHCAYIPNGHYWLNVVNGAWGYHGNPWIQGYLGQPCRGNGGGRHRSLSERGLLYTPGDLNFR